MDLQRELEIIELIKKEVKPALGCTEPIAVSLAVARSCEALREIGAEVGNVVVEVSANILKNGMGVGIPGTGMVGLHIAAALGIIPGRGSPGQGIVDPSGGFPGDRIAGSPADPRHHPCGNGPGFTSGKQRYLQGAGEGIPLLHLDPGRGCLFLQIHGKFVDNKHHHSS